MARGLQQAMTTAATARLPSDVDYDRVDDLLISVLDAHFA